MSIPLWRSKAKDNVRVKVITYDLKSLDPFKTSRLRLLEVRKEFYSLDAGRGTHLKFERKPYLKHQDSAMDGATFPNNWVVIRPSEWQKIEALVAGEKDAKTQKRNGPSGRNPVRAKKVSKPRPRVGAKGRVVGAKRGKAGKAPARMHKSPARVGKGNHRAKRVAPARKSKRGTRGR
jgi:hypothetical protein